MIYFVRLENGQPASWGTRPDALPDGALEVRPEVYANQGRMWLDAGTWRVRPMPTVAVQHADGVTLGDVPADAEVQVWDAEMGDLLGTLQPDAGGFVRVRLLDAGAYDIEVVGPWPLMPFSMRFTLP